MPRVRVERPSPKTRYQVWARSAQVLKDWERLLRTRAEVCIRCWEHIANIPTTPIGERYGPMARDQAYVEFEGQQLRQSQYEIDRRARVKVGVGPDFVVIVSVDAGHPKANE